ncbi:MAG: hypothetical protein PHW50_03085 [Patescibacteria group bacterium]|nr:hypothetical protein [Patescibacteria group bacterium]
MSQVTMPIRWPTKIISAIINYSEDYTETAEITVDYLGASIKVFEQSDDGRWVFNPSGLPYKPKVNDPVDVELFFLESEVLYYILTHEPINLPLNSCTRECGDWQCCCSPPALTEKEARTIFSNHGKESLDLNGDRAKVAHNGLFCFFLNQELGICRLHDLDYRPIQCKWQCCQMVRKIRNFYELPVFINAIFPTVPSSLLDDLVPQ